MQRRWPASSASPRREVTLTRLAAELHDVGKTAIPDSILDKPGPLDEQEMAFMRRHTIIGQRILAAAPALAQVALLVRSTHERADGKGYPDGLRLDEIPLNSRIVSVVDAYDAMTSHRPYAPPLTPEEALAEIERCAGTQFDPVIVKAFAAVWQTLGEGGKERVADVPDSRAEAAARGELVGATSRSGWSRQPLSPGEGAVA